MSAATRWLAAAVGQPSGHVRAAADSCPQASGHPGHSQADRRKTPMISGRTLARTLSGAASGHCPQRTLCPECPETRIHWLRTTVRTIRGHVSGTSGRTPGPSIGPVCRWSRSKTPRLKSRRLRGRLCPEQLVSALPGHRIGRRILEVADRALLALLGSGEHRLHRGDEMVDLEGFAQHRHLERTADVVGLVSGTHDQRRRTRADALADALKDVDPVGDAAEPDVQHDRVGLRACPLALRGADVPRDDYLPARAENLLKERDRRLIVLDDEDLRATWRCRPLHVGTVAPQRAAELGISEQQLSRWENYGERWS